MMPSRLSSYVVIRRAGLPFRALGPLASERVRVLADELDALEAWLDPAGPRLSEALHDAIGGETDRAFRRDLLTVRRAVFNARLPRDPELVAGIAADPRLDAGLRVELAAWAERVDRRDALTASAEDAADADRRALSAALSELWRVPAVRTGILFAQPRLRRELDDGFASDGDEPPVWGKPLESMLAYVCRMATKTSPFSTFTTLDIRRSSRAPGTEAAHAPDAGGMDASVIPDVGWVEALGGRMSAHTELRAHLPVRVNPTLEDGDDAVHFLARASRPVPHATAGTGEEAIRSIGRDPRVDLVLLVARSLEPPATWASLTDRIAALVEEPSLRRSLARVVEQLLEADALLVGPEHAAEESRLLSGLAGSLRPQPNGDAAEERTRGTVAAVRDGLLAMDRAIGSLAGAPDGDGPTRLAAVHDRAAEVAALLGGTESVPRTDRLVHHQCYDAAPPAPAPALDTVSAALDRVFRILPLFDTDHAVRTGVTAAYPRLFSTTEQVRPFTFFRRLCADAKLAAALPDPFAAGIAGHADAAALERERDRLIDEVRPRVQGCREPVELSAAFLDEWGERAAAVRPPYPPASAAVLAQEIRGRRAASPRQDPGESPGAPRLVINKVVPGYGTLLARLAASGDAGAEAGVHGCGRAWLRDELADALAALDPDGEVAELVATFGFGGQLRPPLTPRCILYPGEAIRRTEQPEVPWDALRVRWNARRQAPELFDAERDRRLLPVHLGTLSSLYFPSFYRFLTAFGPAFTPDLAWLHFLDAAGHDGGIRSYARLTHQGVVLLRRTWCVPAGEIPERDGAGDVADFRRLRSWARAMGFPRRVFVTPLRIEEYLRGEGGTQSLPRARKPFYVDWEEPSLHRLFRRYTRVPGGTITVAEMLPDPGQASGSADGGAEPRAMELVFELTGSEGGRQ